MKSWPFRGFARTCCLLAGLIALAAAGHAAPLVLAVSDGPVSLPVYVAEAEGFFQREGLQMRLLPCASGAACFQRMSEGRADVATASELLVTLDSIRRSDAVVIATISSSMHHIKLVARRDAGIGSPDDMRGKRVATVAGSSAQYFLDAWLLYHGIDHRDVRPVAVPPEQIADALVNRTVDAVAIWEPAASRAIAVLGAGALVLPNPRVYTQHFSLATSRRRIDQRPEELMKMLRALARAERFIAAEPARSRAILAARLPGCGDARLAEHDFGLRLPQSLIATMEAEARWAAREGLGVAPVSVLRSIEPSLLRQAVPGAVELAH